MHEHPSSGHRPPRKPLHTETKRELQRLDEEARRDLDLLRQEVSAAHGTPTDNVLVQANEHLALALLSAQAELGRSPRAEGGAERRSANHDALTGLPNRVLLLAQFELAIASARLSGRRLAVLFLDLDNFKQVNDTLGHAVGDAVLRHVAGCLNGAVRKGDTVSRHGGDEFVVLLNDIAKPADASRVATEMLACMAALQQIGEHELQFGASIGISIYPDDGQEPARLIHLADAAMYRAKREGAGRYCFHDARQTTAVPRKRTNVASRRATDFQLQELRQNQLQEANEQLLLAALGAQELQAAAERSKEAQTLFMALVAHELRNPLAPIRNAATLLSRVPASELPKLQAVIERQVEHVTRMIADLLDISRVETGKLSLQRRTLDFCSLVAEATDTCRPAMEAREQTLRVDVPPGPLLVDGDSTRLVQVLCNLLDNASKYTPKGGSISLDLQVVGDNLVTTVADNGIGMSAEALSKVFTPFVQDPQAITFNGTGLGIGLTVVRELVESHGGTVVAESEGEGKGSRFVLTIPLLGEASGSEPEA